jgi:ABC-type sulfate transport system substrate-binding protein
MTTKNFYLALTAGVGLMVGGAWARANQLDKMTEVLRVANQKVEASIAERNQRYDALLKKEYISYGKKTVGTKTSVARSKGGASNQAKSVTNNASRSRMVADSTARDTSMKVLPFDSSNYKRVIGPATSSIRLREPYVLTSTSRF